MRGTFVGAAVAQAAGPVAMLEFFATDEALAELESALSRAQASGTQAAQTRAGIAVAWQIRQRDTRRALRLAGEAGKHLTSEHFSPAEQRHLGARLQLIQAEAQWLIGERDVGRTLAEAALQAFVALEDDTGPDADAACANAIGCADAHWLLAWLTLDQGDWARSASELEATVAKASAFDAVRALIAQAALARDEAFRNAAAAKEKWNALYALDPAGIHPAAACWLENFWSVVASQSSDYVDSVRHKSAAYRWALSSGQHLRAMVIASNIGDNFNSLCDHLTALEWMQRALDMARACAWPGEVGGALMQTANALRGLQRFEAAAQMLREAVACMAQLTSSRDYAIALLYLGEVELDRQAYASALENFVLLEQRALALRQTDLLCDAQRGQAKALLELGRPQPALQAAQAAIAGAGADAMGQIAALRVMADIHTRHNLPPPTDMREASAALHYLQQALDTAASMENYLVPGDLYADLAREHAKLGSMAKAYALSLQASRAWQTIHSTEAHNRANAMQVNHEIEKVRAEAEHQRQLAQVHAERADALVQAKATLEQLGEIGREITASLDTDAIFSTLYRHVHALLDVTLFAIDRLESDGMALRTVFGMERGQPLPPHHYRIDDAQGHAARCARERAVLVVGARTALFAPLQVGERLLGIMTVQCIHPRAYTERDVAIFRTLSAYVSIALANNEAQMRLVQSQKLASLGRMVAGVSHALNTPLDIGLMAVSTLRDSLQTFEQAVSTSGLKRQTLDTFVGAVQEGSMLALRSLERGASLVQSFKQVAVDHRVAARRVFLVSDVLDRVRSQLLPRLQGTHFELTVTAPADLKMDSFADALSDTLVGLLDNALVHGFEGQDRGSMSVECHALDAHWVRIVVQDDGCGIAPAHQAKVFDPFFTTRMGQCSGLGLHTAHNNVTQLLMGTLTLHSTPGAGCRFELVLPLVPVT